MAGTYWNLPFPDWILAGNFRLSQATQPKGLDENNMN
jgi:hypothetical protein